MNRIFFALFLLLVGCGVLFSIFFLKTTDLLSALEQVLELYIPIAGAVLLIALLLQSGKKNKLFFPSFCYIFIVLGGQIGLKEYLLPTLQAPPSVASLSTNASQQMILKEFDQMSSLPQKQGMILQNNSVCFIFGTIAQQNPSSYLIKQAFFKGTNHQKLPLALFSEYAKIIDRSIILYQTTLMVEKNGVLTTEQDLPKNYELPLPFDTASFFKLWNTTDPMEIGLVPIIQHRTFSRSFALPIMLAVAQYFLGFTFLLIISIFGVSLSNSLSFQGAQVLGNSVVILCTYPFALTLYYYLSLIAQSTIYYIIKI